MQALATGPSDISPLTLQEYAKKRNEIAKRYGNKTMPSYMWKQLYENSYLPGLKENDPAILSLYHSVRNASRQFKAYCDMDGVLTNFAAAVEKLGPEAVKGLGDDADPQAKQVMYDAIEKAGESFWSEMPWMPDGERLWGWLKQFKPVLLTSPGKFQYAVSGKTQWVKNNIPGTSIFFEEDKWQWAERRSILIDDKEQNIIAWQSKGGVGIIHKDAKSTIDAVLWAVKNISPSRAEHVVTIETLGELQTHLKMGGSIKSVADFLKIVAKSL